MVSKFNNFRPQLVFAEQSAGSAVVLTTEQKLSLYKKSQKSGISTDVLEEVYRRGYAIWNESFGQTADQFAFDRVNSFIAGGFAAELDEDLMNEEKKGLWANIHAKRKRIKAGSGEKMRKPGSEGAPTDAALKASQTNEEKDPCWKGYKQIGMKNKNGRQVPNCVPVKEGDETAEKQSTNPNNPSSRFDGTDSLVNIYKKNTPGQMKESNTLSTIKRVLSEQTPDWAKVKAAVRKVESGSHEGNYSIPKPKGLKGSASGAYGFTNRTWRAETARQGVGTEYKRAYQAPPEVQNKVMRTKTIRNYNAAGGDKNPEAALRAAINIHFTGNPAGKMSEKAIKNNRGVTSDTYWSRFQRAMETPSSAAQPSQPSQPAQPRRAAATPSLPSSPPPPPPRPADLDSKPEATTPRSATTSASDTGVRTVVRGDTLSGISKSSGIDIPTIQKLNPDITNPDKINVGQKIRLKEESFSSAFKSARAAGKETFEWKGKSFTTQKKGEAPKPPAAKAETPKTPAQPAAPAATTAKSGPLKPVGGAVDYTLGYNASQGFRKTSGAPTETKPEVVKQDFTLGSSPRSGLRTSGGALTPEITKKPEGKDYTLGSQRTLQSGTPKAPEKPAATPAKTTTVASKDNFEKDIENWMTRQVDRLTSNRRSETPAKPQEPKAPEAPGYKMIRDRAQGASVAAVNRANALGSRDITARRDEVSKNLGPEADKFLFGAPSNIGTGSRHGAIPTNPSADSNVSDDTKKKLKTIKEATHQGRKVTLNKPFRTPGGPKKSAVYVDPDGDGKAKIVRFGDPNLSIKKNQPNRKKSYCARSSGQGNLTKKDSANYWSRRAWDC